MCLLETRSTTGGGSRARPPRGAQEDAGEGRATGRVDARAASRALCGRDEEARVLLSRRESAAAPPRRARTIASGCRRRVLFDLWDDLYRAVRSSSWGLADAESLLRRQARPKVPASAKRRVLLVRADLSSGRAAENSHLRDASRPLVHDGRGLRNAMVRIMPRSAPGPARAGRSQPDPDRLVDAAGTSRQNPAEVVVPRPRGRRGGGPQRKAGASLHRFVEKLAAADRKRL